MPELVIVKINVQGETAMKKKLFTEIPSLISGQLSLHKISLSDAGSLKTLTDNPTVYRYLPTFLYEKKYQDTEYVIRHLYDECFQESIILGIYQNAVFCGLAEMYGFRDEIHKISIGYRLSEECWGKGIASKAVALMIDYLYGETDIEIITASTMIENHASAKVLQKNGFDLVSAAVPEDWGYPSPTIADKWIR